MRLTDRAIARLRPREQEYTVWDNQFVGLGVRVRPTGGRSYVLLEDTGGRSRRVSLGPVLLKTVAEVRRECHARKAEPEVAGAPRHAAPLFRDFVEGAWKEAHFEGYKPSTRKGVRSVLDRQLLPAFGAKPLDRITPEQIGRWFDRFSQTAPGNANHALDLLTQIINFAIARGYLETNPARSVERNPRRVLTRFLSREEISRLHRGLCCKLGEGAMRDQGASCSPYDSALARRSCSHAMASVRAHGPRPKARSTIRASPTMPPWRANIPAWPLRSARITSKPLIVA